MEAADILSNLTKSLKSMNTAFDSSSKGGSKIDMTDVDESVEEAIKLGNIDPHSDFKSFVRELADVEDMISKYNGLIKQLKEKKDELKTNTINHMVKYNFEVAKITNDDKFSLVSVKRTVNPMSKARLQDKLIEYFMVEEKMDEEKAASMSKNIYDWLHKTAETKMDHMLRRYKK